MTPSFVIIGAQKAGTSSLYSHLSEHPDIAGAIKKEVHYFDSPEYSMGDNWYRQHFPKYRKFRDMTRERDELDYITGESSPYYLPHPSTPQRLAKYWPKMKLIVLLRDPVYRALSHFHHQVRHNAEPLSFPEALEQESDRLGSEYQKMLDNPDYYSHAYWAYSYQTRGLYHEQLKHWLKYFPRDQMLILSSEQFFANPQSAYDSCLNFLEREHFVPKNFRKQNTGEYKKMEVSTESLLSARFREENQRLFELIGEEYDWTT